MNQQLKKYVEGIKETNTQAKISAKERVDNLIKPPQSLGLLEEIAVKLAGITGNVKNDLKKKCVLVMCSDNGVFEEGVASAPQEVTVAMTANFIKGVTGVAVFAKASGADLKVYDVGINTDDLIPGVINKKIRKSTSNIKLGVAMSYEEAESAVLIGINAVKEAADEGYNLIGVGEMGIGNTTTTTAILSALTNKPVSEITGRGAGLSTAAYEKKITVIEEAVKINTPNVKDPVDLIAKLGGFDIGAMTGVFIGAAYYGIPVVVDGYISICSAYLAAMMNERVKEYMFLSHVSEEPGYKSYRDLLGIEAPLYLNMRLGEGSGCPIMFDVIKQSCAMINDMATFAEALADSQEEYLDNTKG